jgi:hypothetical protein
MERRFQENRFLLPTGADYHRAGFRVTVMKDRRSAFALICVCSLALFSADLAVPRAVASADDSAFREYAVKAAFIYNALKFVDWTSIDSEVRLCILGENPFGKDIEDIQGRTVKDKPLTIKPIHAVSEAKDCRAVFVCASEREHLASIVEALGTREVLTIGDSTGFAQQGVILNFYPENGSVHFQINLDAAKRAGIKFDSRLLKLATIVSDTQK